MEVGIKVFDHHLEEATNQKQLIKLINELIDSAYFCK